MKTVAFKTLGCKVNQYETQLMREQILGAGFKEVNSAADLYVINTCTVTQKADADCRRLIRQAGRENPIAKIVVTGCYTELDADEIKKICDKIIIVPNAEKDKIVQCLEPGDRHFNTKKYLSLQISGFEGRTKAFVKVQDGCDNFCSYCKVPYVRGRSRSRPSQEIIEEMKKLVRAGYKEIILTGICLGAWGAEYGNSLKDLLKEIKAVDGIFRVRLSSIEPWYVTEELIRVVGDSNKFCRHFHIPMQSGDDETLKKMNRKFNVDSFIALIGHIRSMIPGVAFTTDILVGFPGESEGQFGNTLKFVKSTGPSRAHIFPYSRRDGTAAASFADQIPAGLIRSRAAKLKALTDSLAVEYVKSLNGKPQRVLVELRRDARTGALAGYTDSYIKVAFFGDDELKGQLINVRVSDKIGESAADPRQKELPLTNVYPYDILAAHLEREQIKLGSRRLYSEDKLDRFISCNSFSQK